MIVNNIPPISVLSAGSPNKTCAFDALLKNVKPTFVFPSKSNSSANVFAVKDHECSDALPADQNQFSHMNTTFR